MTNNRKPVDEVRLSLSAARKREAGTHLYERLADKDMRDKPYTPPPNVAAWLQAQADKPKGRDYDAILRAAKKAPVGYYEDAPTGIKFGASSARSPGASEVGGLTKTPTHAPTPPQSADGPWPKRIMGAAALGILEGPHKGTAYYRSGTVCCISCKGIVDSWLNALQGSYRLASEAEALQWLEQNGHKDVAAQLRGKGATGGGRAWKFGSLDWRGCVIEGRAYQAWDGVWISISTHDFDTDEQYTELFGAERDAILSECRKAMGLK